MLLKLYITYSFQVVNPVNFDIMVKNMSKMRVNKVYNLVATLKFDNVLRSIDDKMVTVDIKE